MQIQSLSIYTRENYIHIHINIYVYYTYAVYNTKQSSRGVLAELIDRHTIRVVQGRAHSCSHPPVLHYQNYHLSFTLTVPHSSLILFLLFIHRPLQPERPVLISIQPQNSTQSRSPLPTFFTTPLFDTIPLPNYFLYVNLSLSIQYHPKHPPEKNKKKTKIIINIKINDKIKFEKNYLLDCIFNVFFQFIYIYYYLEVCFVRVKNKEEIRDRLYKYFFFVFFF